MRHIITDKRVIILSSNLAICVSAYTDTIARVNLHDKSIKGQGHSVNRLY